MKEASAGAIAYVIPKSELNPDNLMSLNSFVVRRAMEAVIEVALKKKSFKCD